MSGHPTYPANTGLMDWSAGNSGSPQAVVANYNFTLPPSDATLENDMAEMTIRLRTDPATGKKDIIIGLRSDDDALPHEHEQQHKALVEKLLGSGILKPSEVGHVQVERQSEEDQGATEPAQPDSERRAEGQAG